MKGGMAIIDTAGLKVENAIPTLLEFDLTAVRGATHTVKPGLKADCPQPKKQHRGGLKRPGKDTAPSSLQCNLDSIIGSDSVQIPLRVLALQMKPMKRATLFGVDLYVCGALISVIEVYYW